MKSVKQNYLNIIKENIQKFYYKHKPVDTRDKLRLVVLAIALPVFIYSSYQLIYKLYTYVYEDNQMQAVVDQKPDSEKNPFENLDTSEDSSNGLPYQVIEGKDSYLNAEGILKEYQTLWERNHDLVGWINFPGFTPKPINYPMVYSGDNSYYLRRDYDGVDSVAGSIFIDGSNTPYSQANPVLDKNYVIYGHAMGNRSMFGNITDYWVNEKSWKNHTIYIDFMNTRLEYEVFSTFVCDPYFNYRQTHFSSDEQYKEYLDMLVAKSTHDFGQTLGVDDRIITLSTCYKKTRRNAVVAKLVRQIVYSKNSHGNIDIAVTPIVMPTYMPFKIPTRTPSPTKGPTPAATAGVTPGTTPGITNTPTITPVPKVLLNLLTNPGLETGIAEEWAANTTDQTVTAVGDLAHAGSYSGYLDNLSTLQGMAIRDVTDILTANGKGRYSAEAYVRSKDAETSASIILSVTIRRTPAATSEDPEPTPVDETLTYSSAVAAINSSSWTSAGNKTAYLMTPDSNDVVSWDDATLVSAYLLIVSDSSSVVNFYFDDISLYKENVFVEPLPTPTVTASGTSSMISSESIASEPEPTVTPVPSEVSSSVESSLVTSSEMMNQSKLPGSFQRV